MYAAIDRDDSAFLQATWPIIQFIDVSYLVQMITDADQFVQIRRPLLHYLL